MKVPRKGQGPIANCAWLCLSNFDTVNEIPESNVHQQQHGHVCQMYSTEFSTHNYTLAVANFSAQLLQYKQPNGTSRNLS